MLAMVKSNPELGRTMPAASATAERPSSVYNIHRPAGSISQANRRSYVGSPNGEPMSPGLGDGEDEDGTGSGQFTYIPPHPKKFYRRLLELCISADLEAMLSDAVDDDDEVSLGILTLPHLELLNECALRWRIGQPYRATAFLDIVRQFYERNDVPLECIPEALQSVEKVKADLNHVQEAGGHDLALWPVSDVSMWSIVLQTQSTNFLCVSPAIARVPCDCIRPTIWYLPLRTFPRHGQHPQPEAR
jgi:hypothetical protein